jgi:hypothetical protein
LPPKLYQLPFHHAKPISTRETEPPLIDAKAAPHFFVKPPSNNSSVFQVFPASLFRIAVSFPLANPVSFSGPGGLLAKRPRSCAAPASKKTQISLRPQMRGRRKTLSRDED